MKFSKIQSSYTSKDGCRLVWKGVDEDDQHAVILNKAELEQLVEIMKENSSGKICNKIQRKSSEFWQASQQSCY